MNLICTEWIYCLGLNDIENPCVSCKSHFTRTHEASVRQEPAPVNLVGCINETWFLSIAVCELSKSMPSFTSIGGCRREEKSHKHWSFFTIFSHWNFVDQIKSNCMYWLHWKSEKNGTEPNELDELKYSKSLNQTTSYAHWYAFLYLHAQTCIKTFIFPIQNQKKRLS